MLSQTIIEKYCSHYLTVNFRLEVKNCFIKLLTNSRNIHKSQQGEKGREFSTTGRIHSEKLIININFYPSVITIYLRLQKVEKVMKKDKL